MNTQDSRTDERGGPRFDDMDAYQTMAQRTSKNHGHKQVLNGLMGLNGEAGEAIDLLKKHLFQGHDYPRQRLIEELGDALWYIAEAAAGLEVKLSEVARLNIDKLTARYPDGFTAERSVHREESLDDTLQEMSAIKLCSMLAGDRDVAIRERDEARQLVAKVCDICDKYCAGEVDMGIQPCFFFQPTDVDENGITVGGRCISVEYRKLYADNGGMRDDEQ